MPAIDWWEDPSNIADLVRWLDRNDQIAESDVLRHVLEILDRPDRWTTEYEQMRKEEMIANAEPIDDDVAFEADTDPGEPECDAD
jgi:hypothetical protein